MTKIGIIRCEKNENICPMTACFQCLSENKEGFERYDSCVLAGVFTCRCPGYNADVMAKILHSKGAEVIHFCTCTFAKNIGGKWITKDGGFCDNIDTLLEYIHEETKIPCVKGTAHLPKDYVLEVLGQSYTETPIKD